MMLTRDRVVKQDFRFAPAMLLKNTSLLVLPVISGLLTLLVTAFVGLLVLPSIEAMIDAEATGRSISGADIVILLAAYFVIAIIATILNAAVVAAALELVKGGQPTVGAAVSTAMRHALPLAGWGLINATVGLVLSAIRRNNSGGLGGILTTILGFLLSAAWGILTFFTVPVILVEGAGPIGGIRRSASLMSATFGGGLDSLRKAWSYGLGWLILLALLSIGGVALGVLGFSQLDANAAVGGVLAVIGVALIAMAVVLNAAVGAIVPAALYFYAVERKAPAGFPAGAVEGAFAPAA